MELAEFFLLLSVLLNWISARRFSSVAFMSLSMRELAFFGQFVRSWFLVVLRFEISMFLDLILRTNSLFCFLSSLRLLMSSVFSLVLL